MVSTLYKCSFKESQQQTEGYDDHFRVIGQEGASDSLPYSSKLSYIKPNISLPSLCYQALVKKPLSC